MRKVTLTSAKKKLWKIFSEYIRKRDCLLTTGCIDWGLCVTCGRRYHFKLLQAGHFISGRHNAGLFSERGTHAQCYNCNINLKGNTLEYRRKIIEMYGPGADEVLEAEARQVVQQKVFELEELATEYKEKIKTLERERCLKNLPSASITKPEGVSESGETPKKHASITKET